MRTMSAVLAFGVLSGCFRDLQHIRRLQPDGSGTLIYTRLMKSWAMEQARKNGGDDCTEAKARARAAELGEGVAFRSAEKLKEGDWEGLRATYDFKDIARLKIDEDGSFTLARRPDGNRLLTATTRFRPSKPSAGKDALEFAP